MLGLVAVGATAAVIAVAPPTPVVALAPAVDCPSRTDDRGNVGQFDECNVFGQNVGQGNTLNGVPVPNPFVPVPAPGDGGDDGGDGGQTGTV